MDWRVCGLGTGAEIAGGWRVDASFWYGELGVVATEKRKCCMSSVRLRFVKAECTEVFIHVG